MLDLDAWSLSVLGAAAGVAVTHTALGPDHYLPFVMLARARNWSVARTLWVTAACGLGHVASSVLLGVLGLAAGMAVAQLETVEGGRGDLAAWALVAFGLAYGVWGIRRAVRGARGLEPHDHHGHVHLHTHGADPDHRHHEHGHVGHDHGDGAEGTGRTTTFWALFVVFVLGPCEPMIPLFVLPASRGDWLLAAVTGGVFGVITIATMTALVAAMLAGYRRLPLGPLERWSHALAGAVVAASGGAILMFGL